RVSPLSNHDVGNQRRYMYGFFGQDDWKVSPRLTLNLGLRYDFGSPAYEVNNRMANFDPVAARTVTSIPEAMAAVGLAADDSPPSRALVNPDHLNFAPRIGFAYSPRENWVVRGG